VIAETVAAATTVSPGYCADHPTQQLMTPKQAGLRTYSWNGRTDPAVVCPAKDHDDYTRDRCRWCGGLLDPERRPYWRRSSKLTYCTPNHRLRAFRAGQAGPRR